MKKTILITGASSGMGKMTAKLFQQKGWNVIATMRTPEKEEELVKLENILVTKLDVTDSSSIKNAVEEGINKFGKIDVLLNNAGYGTCGPLEAFSMESIRRQFDVNVMGLLETTKALLPHFRENKDGMIVNISSMVGKVSLPLASLYNGTKFAVEGITESLQYEMEGIGVKVKLIEPGMTKTNFVGSSFDLQNDESLVEYQDLLNKALKNVGSMVTNGSEPEVVADVIYEAVTDGTNILRYTAGEDSKELVKTRNQLTDEQLFEGMKTQINS